MRNRVFSHYICKIILIKPTVKRVGGVVNPMKLFVSYARVDKPYCLQIVDMLDDTHKVWVDHRIHVGQNWWKVICDEIEQCDGFVYLISPESVESKYCQKELRIAQDINKHIFPVLIHHEAEIPESLKQLHHADFTQGLTPKAVRDLLNAIHVAELRGRNEYRPGEKKVSTYATVDGKLSTGQMPTVVIEPFKIEPEKLTADVNSAMEQEQYDQVVFLLKQAKEYDCDLKYIDIEALLKKAEVLLERQTYLREADRMYQPIRDIVQNAAFREQGCAAFKQFREQFPDYDPDNLASSCLLEMLPMLEWCDIPAGEVMIHYEEKPVIFFVESFRLSKYPITNAQFQKFVDDPDGYANPKWWDYNAFAKAFREKNPKVAKPRFQWGDHPRGRIALYEAMAFCEWLSEKSGKHVFIPTEQQWQRAAQGDDNRPFPWGKKFYKTRANSKECGERMTCPVTKYEKWASPFGVVDMAGNTWEWCDSLSYKDRNSKRKRKTDYHRAVRGGAFISTSERVTTTYHFHLPPSYRYPTIGFRVATLLDD